MSPFTWAYVVSSGPGCPIPLLYSIGGWNAICNGQGGGNCSQLLGGAQLITIRVGTKQGQRQFSSMILITGDCVGKEIC
jgi:hypothetical protein